MKVIERRLLQLEQDNPDRACCYAWASFGETVEAITQQFPDGPPDNPTVIVFRFAELPGDCDG